MGKVVFACFFVLVAAVCVELQGGGVAGDITYCVARPSSDEKTLNDTLNFLCTPGVVDCTNINSGGACFKPDTFINHASVAMNKYYQKNHRDSSFCEFKDSQKNPTGLVTVTDPSYAVEGGKCTYDVV